MLASVTARLQRIWSPGINSAGYEQLCMVANCQRYSDGRHAGKVDDCGPGVSRAVAESRQARARLRMQQRAHAVCIQAACTPMLTSAAALESWTGIYVPEHLSKRLEPGAPFTHDNTGYNRAPATPDAATLMQFRMQNIEPLQLRCSVKFLSGVQEDQKQVRMARKPPPLSSLMCLHDKRVSVHQLA